jgi:hypothetical protein
MLFKIKTLEKIKAGEVDLAYRKWKKASVKEGGTLKTSVGLLRIDRIRPVSEIKLKDIKRTEYESLSDGRSAGWISETLHIEKTWLKPNIRKLKEMGLTISLEVGHKISPRGKAYLKSLK